jgi:hypothetical protein
MRNHFFAWIFESFLFSLFNRFDTKWLVSIIGTDAWIARKSCAHDDLSFGCAICHFVEEIGSHLKKLRWNSSKYVGETRKLTKDSITSFIIRSFWWFPCLSGVAAFFATFCDCEKWWLFHLVPVSRLGNNIVWGWECQQWCTLGTLFERVLQCCRPGRVVSSCCLALQTHDCATSSLCWKQP